MALVCLGGFGKAFCVLNPTYFLLCHAENFNVNKQDHFQDLSYFVFIFCTQTPFDWNGISVSVSFGWPTGLRAPVCLWSKLSAILCGNGNFVDTI